MFRSAIEERIWPETGLTTDRWMTEIGLELVDLTDLIATQPTLTARGLSLNHASGTYSRDPYPHIIRYNGLHYIEDGHHRIARWMMGGITTALVRVFVIRPDTPPTPTPTQPK